MANSAKALTPEQVKRLNEWLGPLSSIAQGWSSSERVSLYRTLATGDAFVLNGSALILDEGRKAVLRLEVPARYRGYATLTRGQLYADSSALGPTVPTPVAEPVPVAVQASPGLPAIAVPDGAPTVVRRRNRAPSGKPRKVVVSVRLDPEHVDALEEEADGEAIGIVIRRIVRDYLRGKEGQ